MIILPTLRRPENLKRFIQAYRLTQGTLPIYVVFDAANAAQYSDIELPTHWKKVCAPAGTPIGHIFNLMFRKFPKEEFYGMVADDVVPETLIWDIVLRDSCLPNKISWGWDGIQNEKLPVHPFIGGDLIRELNFWAVPGLHHWFVDNAWKDIADALNVGVYLPNIKMKHHHFINGLAQRDRTYDEQPGHKEDEIIYREFVKLELPRIIEKMSGEPKPATIELPATI